MQELVDAGLGLPYGHLDLVTARAEWTIIGDRLAARVAAALGPLAEGVEHIGSTAVAGLTSKPIIDLAIGLLSDADLAVVEQRLTEQGWIYRGDAGNNGGQIFVLESEPWVRVAHAHGVLHHGDQWNRYLQFRDLLRADADARRMYSSAKSALLDDLEGDDIRRKYIERKSPVVESLLGRS